MSRFLCKEIQNIKTWIPHTSSGRVSHNIGLLITSQGPSVSIGELCYIYGKKNQKIPCEVVGFVDHQVLLMSLVDTQAIAPGSEVFPTQHVQKVPVSMSLKGRILNALGEPIDGKGPLIPEAYYPLISAPPPALSRSFVNKILETQIKAIDCLCTLGRGQRIGIFSGPGVGKSTLLSILAKTCTSDINVIALIGERGREVRAFIEQNLGLEGLAKSVVVVATADQTALMRLKAAQVATAISEYFRDQGKDVLLMMDSISRCAHAMREIGLAVGEMPAWRGYTPSVFATLAKLFERAGNSHLGSITGVYTVLSEKEDLLVDQLHSLLDGKITLSKEYALAGHFPPIDILDSHSRVMNDLVGPEHQKFASLFRDLKQTYEAAQDMIDMGAYVSGSRAKIDQAILKIDAMMRFLKQSKHEQVSLKDSLQELTSILHK